MGIRRLMQARLGTLLGRTLPGVGLLASGLDIATSEDKLRALIGNAGGLVGGALGATALSPTGPGMIAGALGGSYLGNSGALWLYDELTD